MPEGLSAWQLVVSGDPALYAIVRLSLMVSLLAVGLGALIGLPLGGLIALVRFPGRGALIVVINAMMGLPPVVVGLLVFLLLSRSGPLGSFGLLFTPTAMVIAQAVLIAPIIAALTRQIVEDLWLEYRDELQAMGVPPLQRLATAIALETSKGDLPLAMGLGMVLIFIVLAVNASAWGLRVFAEKRIG